MPLSSEGCVSKITSVARIFDGRVRIPACKVIRIESWYGCGYRGFIADLKTAPRYREDENEDGYHAMILLYTKMNVLRNNEKTMLINGQNLSDGSGKNMQKSNEEDNFEPIGKDDLLQTMDTLDDEIKLTEQALAEIRNLTMNSTHDQKNDGSYNQTNGTSDADILSKLKELEDKISYFTKKEDLLLRLRNQQMESQLTNMSSKIKFAKIIVDEEQKIVQWFRTMATAGIQTACIRYSTRR